MVAGLLPWWITGWRPRGLGIWWLPLLAVGAGLIFLGGAVLLHAFARFVREGCGTPMPAAAPERLVVSGAYRYVRNPMYVAVLAVILGQALVLARLELVWYAVAVFVTCAGFVHLYEQPALHRRFGGAYEEYRRAVPAWMPRLRPWNP
ncbi:isoprenylcysteine carboxylmethyltransferase family protein [Actinomadura sp. KC06]|uniref:methyltransferase family protein n=1 Tax=Actinomadura sp. KC06 TaxID=2530369 RepID=UPI001FB81645|nr:isoprenylcysteine carboxylmethyltransferase family protein [Actinomadura sp. KC06]